MRDQFLGCRDTCGVLACRVSSLSDYLPVEVVVEAGAVGCRPLACWVSIDLIVFRRVVDCEVLRPEEFSRDR